jgi:transposase
MQMGWYDRKVCRVRDLSCGDTRIFLELEVRRLDCRSCGKVKRERLGFLADNPHYTKRFAHYVGRRCRAATIKDVAADLKLRRISCLISCNFWPRTACSDGHKAFLASAGGGIRVRPVE